MAKKVKRATTLEPPDQPAQTETAGMAKTKRGIQGCQWFCQKCEKDCRCETCEYCHSCQLYDANRYNASSSGFNASSSAHLWSHNKCSGKAVPDEDDINALKYKNSIDKFLIDTSSRFGQYLETEPFTVKIADDKTFFAHKEALCQASLVFKKEIEADMKESKTKEIVLKECTDKGFAFSMFLQFAYFGSYGYDDLWKEDGLLLHAHVYIFAERLGAPDLKALALQKAVSLCASVLPSDEGGVKNDGLKVVQFILPEIVPVIYGNTYDVNAGKTPSSLEVPKGKNVVKSSIVGREKFRMLLASFAASCIEDLRRNESFMMVLEEYPSFGTDIIIFTAKGTKFKTDGKGNLEI